MGYGFHHAMTGSWFWGLGHWLFWGLLIVLAVLLVRAIIRPDRSDSDDRRSAAVDTLAARFARGEIDAAEYHERKSVLQSDPETP